MNNNIIALKESASIKIMERYQKIINEGKDIIGLTIGEPDFDTPSIVKKIAINEIEHNNTHYCVGTGLYELRNKIANKLSVDNNLRYNPEEIIVTPGAKMAIYLSIVSCINANDEVMVLTPSWVSYFEMVKSCGGIPIEVPLDYKNNYTITEKTLEKYYTSRTKMLIVNSPNNPTGRVITKEEIHEIALFAQNKDIVIISDEVYEKIVYERKNISIASNEKLYSKTITINSFSKSYSMTGWRVGYIAAPINYISSIKKVFSHTCTGIQPFIQKAAIAALDCSTEVERMRISFKERRDFFIKKLSQYSGIHVVCPEGAFYAWVRFDDSENI